MRKIILIILLTLLLAGYGFAKGDSFPSDLRTSISPNRKYEISWTNTKTPPGEDDDAPWYDLRLKDTSTGEDRSIKKFLRSVDVLWSPDSRHFAVTYWWGSNVAWVEIYVAAEDTKGINPYEIIKKTLGKLPEVEGDNHVYFEAIKWEDGEHLVVNVFGHWDRPGAENFNHHFEVALSGNARRLEKQ